MPHPYTTPMTTPRIWSCLTLLIALLGAAGVARAQSGQSLNDLRRENDQLRERIAQLEAQLETERQAHETKTSELTEAFRAQMARMGEEVQRLLKENAALRSGESPDATSGPASSAPEEPLPEDPFACPDSMLAALVASYAEEFGDDTPRTDSERQQRTREVRLWARKMSTSYRRTVEWEIEVLAVEAVKDSNGRDMVLEFQVLNPDTGGAWGDTVRAEMSARYLRRVADKPETTHWNLRALFAVEPNLNPERTEEGLLNTPPFIGPFAEFVWELKPQSIVEKKEG